jgi:hypothetical protein
VTSFRSDPEATVVSSSALPQVAQNRWSSVTDAPQFGHRRPRAAPHDGQNREPSGTLAPQVPHVITARV